MLVVTLFTLNSVLLFLSALLRSPSITGFQSNIFQDKALLSLSSKWTDNIAFKSFEEQLCAEPIDIVYTWVNGSDPRQIEALAKVKDELDLEHENTTGLRRCNSTQNPAEDNCLKDDASANRYIDNEELRYSLRSVEKFAPWVRRIYIVTNGQIPSWLNLDLPKLKIITHSQIYANKSHLPVFSSPSIETQLHNIPGLSRRWIYLNDDVMFGSPIWPSDFYSEARGQRLYLSWPVPNCAENCPSNWLGDGYCDLACNNTECDYDSGDCLNSVSMRNDNSNWWWANSANKDTPNDNYCAKGCPDTWIGDKYCDRSCRQAECGMDGGDCGANVVWESMGGLPVTREDKNITMESGLRSIYFNLSIPENHEIISASYDNNRLVRSAVVLQKSKVLVVVFFRNTGNANVTFDLDVKAPANGSSVAATPGEPDYVFNFTLHFEAVNGSGTSTGNVSSGNVTTGSPAKRYIGSEGTVDSPHPHPIPDISPDPSPSSLSTPSPTSTPNSSPTSWQTRYSRYGATATSPVFSGGATTSTPTTKKQLDNYGESLKYVNKLMTAKFGAEARRVPAHMPHFINTPVLKDLLDTWPKQFDETSSHKLRSPTDVQYAFAYYYFLMNQKIDYDFDNYFDEHFDTDKDGELSPNELRTLIMTMNGGAMEQSLYLNFREVNFVLCLNATNTTNSTARHANVSAPVHPLEPLSVDLNSTNSSETNETVTNTTKPPPKRKYTPDEELPRFTKEYIKNCTLAKTKIDTFGKKQKRNKYEIIETDDVAFVMIGTNSSDVRKALDGIRNKKHKFICLNDNMNHSNPHSIEVVKVIQEFYKSFLPLPSSYELPPNVTNKYFYIEEKLKSEEEIESRKSVIYKFVVIMLLSLFCLATICTRTSDSFNSRFGNTQNERNARIKRLNQL
uniref:EF-hand domain-containing protein n=1 Tax=Arcella intermedia TaxID=1963864 RepID=A0A6B2KXE3_9EUKA